MDNHFRILQTPLEEYLRYPAVSKHLLDAIARSPAHGLAAMRAEPTPPTLAQRIGTAVHTAILEPERYEATYEVWDGERRTKAGKEAYAALQEDGKTPISLEESVAINGMRRAVLAHPEASRLLRSAGYTERSIIWTDCTGLECKARPDYWIPSGDEAAVVELKTTADASPGAFARDMAKYRYAYQAAWYQRATSAERTIFIAVEKEPPYAVACYDLDALVIELADERIDTLLGQWADCVAANRWPAYGDDVTRLDLPQWAFDEIVTEGL